MRRATQRLPILESRTVVMGILPPTSMPLGAPFSKMKHSKDFEVRIVLERATLAEASVYAQALAAAENPVFVHPYDDPKIMAG